MSKRKLHAIGAAGRFLPNQPSFPPHFLGDSFLRRLAMLALCLAYASAISFADAGTGVGDHSELPVSSASISIFSSPMICQAISAAVRDFGSGLYVEPSGIREITLLEIGRAHV